MQSPRWLVTLLAALMLATPALAQAQPEDETAATDQQRLELLERQVEVLQLQIKILQNTIAELRATVAAVESGRPTATADATGEIARQPGDDTQPRVSSTASSRRPANPLLAPESQPRRRNPLLPPAATSSADVLGERTPPPAVTDSNLPPRAELIPAPAPQVPEEADFSSVQDILLALPDDAGPDDDLGWTTARHAKALAWLKENVAGKTFRGHAVLFARSIGGVERPEPGAADQVSRYRVVIDLAPERFLTDSMTHEGRLRGADGDALAVALPEQLATQARNLLREGQNVPIEGTIHEVRLPLASSTRTLIEVRLSNYKIANLRP